MTKTKICRVKDHDTASRLSFLGADFIGIHVVRIPTNPELEELESLFDHCRALTCKSVLVTKHLNVTKIEEVTRLVKPDLLQLHDPWEPMEAQRMAENAETMPVLDPITGANAWVLNPNTPVKYVLIDHIAGGTGKEVDAKIISKSLNHLQGSRVFIAGGLNCKNVSSVIKLYRPYGVDVQSSLEIPGKKGEKDFSAAEEFIRVVKET